MAVPSEGRGEDFRVIIGEDIVYLRVMRRVGRAVGDEGEEGLEWRRVLQWLLADWRQLLGLAPARDITFGDRTGRRMLVGQWIRAGHDGPRSLSREVVCDDGAGYGDSDGIGGVWGLRWRQLAPLTNWHWQRGGAAEAGCVCMLEPC